MSGEKQKDDRCNSTVGKPISDDERRKRSFEHLLLYGVQMMVRRDNGGRDDIENLPDTLGKSFVGKTAAEAGVEAAALLFKQLNGVRDRQKRSVEDMRRRIRCLKDVLDSKLSREEILQVIGKVVNGEGFELPPTPMEHVLR